MCLSTVKVTNNIFFIFCLNAARSNENFLPNGNTIQMLSEGDPGEDVGNLNLHASYMKISDWYTLTKKTVQLFKFSFNRSSIHLKN